MSPISMLGGMAVGLAGTLAMNSIKRAPNLWQKPWEHIASVAIMGYLGHKNQQAETFLEERVALTIRQRLGNTQSDYEPQYRKLLGSSYDKYFPQSEA